MTTRLIDHSPAIAAAIRAAFRSSDACHCHGDGKLSETEVLFAFANQGIIHGADVHREDWLPIERVFRFSYLTTDRELERRGVRFLHDLTDWTYADLLALPNVGPAMADNIEAKMAKFGLLLKDGHPNRLAEAEEQKPASHMPLRDGNPDEIRQACAKGLLKIAMRLMNAGNSLIKQAGRATAGYEVGPQLRRHVTRRVPGHEEVARIMTPLREVERQECAIRKTAKKPTGRRRVADRQTVVREGKIIRGAFGDGRAA